MLTITIPGDEFFDEVEQVFVTKGDVVVDLEHSLVSLSKWEAKHQKPFLSKGDKSPEELFDYIRCMVLTPDTPDSVLLRMTKENLEAINAYIDSPQSATTFGADPRKPAKSETVTSELIYYWMVAFTIPFECETWHLNRLLTLVRICNIKNSKPTKMSRSDLAKRNQELNNARRQQLGTSG